MHRVLDMGWMGSAGRCAVKCHSEETQLEVARLAELGLSASEIADKFDGMTRNAIIGLAFRNRRMIELRGNPGTHRKPREKGPRMPRKKKPAQTAGFLLKSSAQPDMKCQALPPEPEMLGDCHPITLLELTDATCKWPIGQSDYVFCGRKTFSGLPYCAHHCRISYAPPQPRRSHR
jgi:GcrA cell cycle regulator